MTDPVKYIREHEGCLFLTFRFAFKTVGFSDVGRETSKRVVTNCRMRTVGRRARKAGEARRRLVDAQHSIGDRLVVDRKASNFLVDIVFVVFVVVVEI